MAKIDDYGNLDYSDPEFQAPAPTPQINKAPQDFQGPGGLDANGNPVPPPASLAGDTVNNGGQPAAPQLSGKDAVYAAITAPGAKVDQGLLDSQGLPAKYYNDSRGETIGLTNGYWANGPTGWQWSDRGPETPGAPAATPTPPGTPAGGSNQGNPALLGLIGQLLSGTSNNNNPLRTSLTSSIQGLLAKYSADPTASDSSIAPQIDAYGSQVDRSMQQYREQAAERAHAEGVPSGAFDSQIGGALTAAGGAKASFAGNAVGTELQNRRQALQGVLNSGQGILGEQDTNDANARIASIDATLKAMGLDVTSTGQANTLALGQGGLANQLTLGQGQLALGNKNSDQQNSQFYDNLTNTMGTDNSLINQILLSLKLGGAGGSTTTA